MPKMRESDTPRPPPTRPCDDCGDCATVAILTAGWSEKHVCFPCAERRRFGKPLR